MTTFVGIALLIGAFVGVLGLIWTLARRTHRETPPATGGDVSYVPNTWTSDHGSSHAHGHPHGCDCSDSGSADCGDAGGCDAGGCDCGGGDGGGSD